MHSHHKMSEAMTFGLLCSNRQLEGRALPPALLTHSQIIYGNPVETCRPYSCDYM